MELLLRYMEAFSCGRQSFRPLPRLQPRYTGLIFEVITKIPSHTSGNGLNDSQVGSIAAGGHYDDLVSMFGRTQIPHVGVSFGVGRIFTILKARREKDGKSQQRGREVDIYVMAFGRGESFNGLLLERMSISSRALGCRH